MANRWRLIKMTENEKTIQAEDLVIDFDREVEASFLMHPCED